MSWLILINTCPGLFFLVSTYSDLLILVTTCLFLLIQGADPEFLERGFICIKVWGSLYGFYLIFLKYLMKMKKNGLRPNFSIFIIDI